MAKDEGNEEHSFVSEEEYIQTAGSNAEFEEYSKEIRRRLALGEDLDEIMNELDEVIVDSKKNGEIVIEEQSEITTPTEAEDEE
jgi:hypothetical protein